MSIQTIQLHSVCALLVVAVVAVITPSLGQAQLIVYDPTMTMNGQQVAPAPMPMQSETYGNLVGRRAFYGRISLGLGTNFFRITDTSASDSVPLTSGLALHTDFSVGMRFAFTHALTFDFDFDRGFSPTLDGDSFPDGTFYSGAFGLGYTNFLSGTGLYFGGGVGLGIAWVEYDDGYSTTASTNTGLGVALYGRVGYDWAISPRAHFGTSFTLRYFGLTDEDQLRWRGAAFAAAGSVAWY